MAEVRLYSGSNGDVGTLDVDVSAFGERSPKRVQREAVLMYRANERSGTASTKTRAEIKGNIKKPWKQKHTGKARAGRKSSPIWRGGGVAHGPRPRDFSYSVPRKALRVACRAAVAGKFLDGEVSFASDLAFDVPSTKQAAAIIEALDCEYSCLVVTAEHDETVWKSMRNLPGVTVMAASDVNAHEVLRHRNLLFTQESFEALAKRVGRQAG